MKAMIFAAGFGTRLRPLTLTTPKPLIPVAGKPMLDHVLGHLAKHGISQAVLNSHYLSEQILAYAQNYQGPIQLEVLVEEGEILGTGGGLWNARASLAGEKDFLLCTADILTDLDLSAFYQAHLASNAQVSLAVNQLQSPGMLLLDQGMGLAGRRNLETKKESLIPNAQPPLAEWGFSGFHWICGEIFERQDAFDFDIISEYLQLASQGTRIQAWDAGGAWFADIGSLEQLQEAQHHLLSRS